MMMTFSGITRWQPKTYGQVWIFAALGMALPIFIVFSIFAATNGWRHPWPALTFAVSGATFVVNGLTLSALLYRRRKRAQ
jgi:4-amino-4-deoxy-L-arabinose transferase-like glycosyltransferase